MSLVGDALRKARREAAERDSSRRGVIYSAKISESPTRSNLGLGLALGAAIAVVATVAGGAGAWWLFGRAADPVKPGADTPAAPATDAAAERGARPEPAPDAAGAAIPTAAPQPPPIPAAEPRREPVAAAAEVRQEPVPRSSVPAAPPSDAEDMTAPAGHGYAGVEDGDEVWIMEAELGTVTLSLDYLVYRDEDPFVEINGVELHLGGTIEGFRVKAIERDRVRLTDGRRTIVLRAP